MSEYGNSAIKARAKLEESKNNSKESNKKLIITLVIAAVLLYVGGYFVGQFVANNEADLSSVMSGLGNFLIVNAYYFASVVSIIMCDVGFSLYAKASKLADKWDGEDDVLMDEVERILFYPGAIAQVMMVISIMAFGVSLCIFSTENASKNQILFTILIATGVMLLSFIWAAILQGKVVSLEKKLNPEKRGNVLDIKFQSKWLESCDEAEKLTIYKAAYDSFKISTYVFGGALIIAILAEFVCRTGIFPIILVSVMWLIQLIVYMNSARKH